MKWKQLNTGRDRLFAVIFAEGDEFSDRMLEFAKKEELTAASFVAIGALKQAQLAWFNPETREYEKRMFEEQLEVLSLAGNVAEHQGQPKVHAHAVLGRRDFSTVGGHLFKAQVRPTLEAMVTESPLHLHRRHDPATGLALIKLDVPDLPPKPGRPADAGTRSAAATESRGLGFGLGFAIHKPEGATNWKECPHCQMWIHGLDRRECPNCGFVFEESHVGS